MISFTLRCGLNHQFDSWFTSSTAFDALKDAGHLSCPTCGNTQIDKALMSPAVTTGEGETAPAAVAVETALPTHAAVSTAMAQIRQMIEQNSDYVGMNFAAEARAMHLGDRPARPIYGEARSDEARALLEDGIPVAPLPFVPRCKTN